MEKKLLILLLAIVMTSCFKEENWSAGPEVTHKIILGPFHTLELNSVFDILLVQDTTDYALVTCGQNLIDNIVITQNNDLLQLDQNTGLNWARTYKHTLVELHFKMLSFIQINKSIRLETKSSVQSPDLSVQDNSPVSEIDITIDCNNFYMSVLRDNFGIYTVSGTTKNCRLEPDGSAHFKTMNLVADSCSFVHHGIGDCFVNAKRVLSGKIIRNGSIFYKYYPSLKLEIEKGSGKVLEIH
jgi:hypothetical protein